MPRVRVHQHVNPLATYFSKLPVEAIDLSNIFENPDLPLFIDIGCGRGRFILKMAELDRSTNFLGLEIRRPLVDEANEIADANELGNLHYHFCNATLALEKLLENLKKDILQTACIQFPDPWFKKRHEKRRMVKDKLAKAILKHLKPSGNVFVQTDVEMVADEIFERFRQFDELREISIDENPFPIKTERENSVEARNLPVYRTMFEKKR